MRTKKAIKGKVIQKGKKVELALRSLLARKIRLHHQRGGVGERQSVGSWEDKKKEKNPKGRQGET